MIDLLEDNGYIKKIADTYGTHLSVCNYDIYQDPNTYTANSDGTQSEHGQNDSETTVRTTNKDKKGKKVKKDKKITDIDGKIDKQTFTPELLPIDSGFTPEQVKLSKVKISKDNIPADKLNGFEEFWDLYDKKNGRTNAMLQWSKISEEDKQAIMLHVPKYKQIREKQFRKDPERYLRHKVWLDEIPVEPVWESYKFNDGKNGSVDGFEDKNTGIVYYPDKKTIFYIPKEKNEKPK